ncbi:radical SAM protein [candidate division KSB1 bacterium]|nr:radical SAM protein [candidate division KSB1 bacterium]
MQAPYSKIKLFSGLLHGKKAFVGPYWLTICISSFCNLSCINCFYHSPSVRSKGNRPKQFIDPQPLFDLCQSAATMGTQEVMISGAGEPLMHPKLDSILSATHIAGLKTTLFTNGTLINDKLIDLLFKYNTNRIRISLWAKSIQEYKKNYPGTDPGMFTQTLKNIELIQGRKQKEDRHLPIVQLHQPLNRHNIENLDQVESFIRSTGIDRVSFSPLKIIDDDLESYYLSETQKSGLIAELKKLAGRLEKTGIGHNIPETLTRYRVGKDVCNALPCYIGFIHACISEDLSVMPCQGAKTPIGHLRKETFTEIWNSKILAEFRQQTKTCAGMKKIIVKNRCNYCCHTYHNYKINRLMKFFPAR